MDKKIMIAMSGGVDSSVAAYIVSKEYKNSVGVTMRLNNEKICDEQACCTKKDIEDAKKVCDKLDISYDVVDFTDKFEEKVVNKFVNTYLEGGTPNPCIDCNRYIKFEKLLETMKAENCDFIVTGHYARVEYNEKINRYILKKGKDITKDQSYVLYSLTQEQLSHIQFPLGEYSKDEIRKIAKENNLINADKKDSQDICFVPDGDYASFIERYKGIESQSGDFILKDGTVIGKHSGIIRYTIGQRKGLGISYNKPIFVSSKNIENNTVTVGDEEELFSKTLIADNINLISISEIKEPIKCKAKVRYRQKEAPATVMQKGDKLIVEFDEPQRAIAKGQALVLYDGDIVIGGGTII